MIKIKGAIVVDTDRCKGCGVCVASCPTKVIQLREKEVNNRGYHFAYMQSDDCIGCSNCATVCPDACIEVYRSKIEV